MIGSLIGNTEDLEIIFVLLQSIFKTNAYKAELFLTGFATFTLAQNTLTGLQTLFFLTTEIGKGPGFCHASCAAIAKIAALERIESAQGSNFASRGS